MLLLCAQFLPSLRKLLMAIALRFNKRKATQAAAHLLKLRGGRMSYLKLVKLLYLADREALLRFGRPISTDRHISMDHGPVLSRVLNLITEGEYPGSDEIWASVISDPSNYEVQLKTDDPESDELSPAELQLLDEVFKEYGSKGRWELVEIAHDLPEWKDPSGSMIPISYGDILRAGGRSELEVASIEDEIRELAEMDRLLAR